MTLIDWIPATTLTVILAAVAWLCRNLIASYLTHSVNTKIEQLKAELNAKQSEIDVLRSGALSSLANRQMAIDQRRLAALDQLWSAVLQLNPARAISNWLSVINFEGAAREAKRNPNAQHLFEMLGSNFDISSLSSPEAHKARPFVSPMAWATYSALHAVCAHAVLRWQILKNGLGDDDYTNTESVNKLLKAVLPHQERFVDQYGPDGYHFLLEEIEQKLLDEIDHMLTRTKESEENLEQAAEIVKRSKELLNQINSARQGAAADAQPAARAARG